MGMGLIGYALAGAGEGLGKGMIDVGMEQIKSELEEARSQRLMEFRQEMEIVKEKRGQAMLDQERTARVNRIDAAKRDLVQGDIQRKYADSDAAVADAEADRTDFPLSPEQRAVIEQAKANDAQAMTDDPNNFVRAGMRTGDIVPKDVIASTQRANRNTTWQDVQMAKIMSGERNVDVRAGATTEAAQIRADASRDTAEARAGSTGSRGLTVPQQVKNREIDAARKIVDALTPEDIKRKTSKFTNTGRENPDYDASLANRVRLAGQRKYGEDDVFDAQLDDAPAKPSPAGNSSAGQGKDIGDIAERFASDPAMKGMRLGRETPTGREVFDASGKLLGHYR